MGTHQIERLPGEPILVSTMYEARSVTDDLLTTIDQIMEHLDAADEPLYYIANFGSMKLGLQDVIRAANQSARGSKAMLHHPNLREFLVVTDVKIIDLAARGLDSEIFGNVSVSVFQTLEEALEYARDGS